MLNSGFRGKRATDGTGAISAQTQSVQATDPVPKINGYLVTDGNYIAIDDTAATTGSTIVVYGNNFVTGMTVYIGNTSVAVTYLDPTRIAFTAPTLSNATYIIYILTPQGAAALLTPGIIYSGFPTWSTSNYSSTVTTINIQLLATGDAPLTYSLQNGSTLPTGITLTSTGVLTGTASSVTTDSVFYFTVIVDDAQLQSTQQSITLTFQFGDPYFKYTTLLLNGETSVTPFINDASTNSFGLTIAGDTKPVLFNPYQGDGYYSNYFDGSGDYLTINHATGSTIAGDFTWETWAYDTFATANGTLMGWRSGSSGWSGFIIQRNNSANLVVNINNGTNITQSNGTYLSNVWNHVALVRSGTTVTLYLNGTSVGTATVSGSFNPGTNTYWIGSDPYNNTANVQLQGYISNQRFVNGTAVYTSTFTPSTTPLTAIANTSLLTCQSNRLIDNSANNFTITKNGDVAVSSAIPFTASSSYSTYGSTYFDGSDSLSMAGNAAYAFGTGDFTVEFWLYMNVDWTSLTNPGIAGQLNGVSAGWQIYRNTGSNDMMLRLVNTSDYGAGTYPATKVWEHWAVTRSGTTLRWFKNGVVTSTASGVSNNVTDTAAIFYIGYTQTWGGYLNGTISDLRIVKGTAVYTSSFTPPTTPLTAITNTQLLTLQYNGGATNSGIIDNSNFNNIITRSGNATQGSFSPYSVTGWSNYFDGTADYLAVASNAAFGLDTGDFTIEAWIYANNSTGILLYDSRTSQTSNGINISVAGSPLVPLYRPAGVTQITGSALTLNTWYHIAVVRSSGITKIYVDGTQTGSSYTDSQNVATAAIRIGANYTANPSSDGYISNFRLVKGTAVYTTTFTPPTIPLTAISGTSLLTCQSNRFIDNSPNNFAITKTGEVSVQALSPFGSISEATPTSYSVYQYVDSSQINVTYSSSLLVGTGQFTIEAWIYVNATRAVQQTIFSNRTYNNIGTGTYTFYVASTTNLLTFDQVQGPATLATSTIAVTIGVWQHVAVSRDSSNLIRLFINGVLVNTPAASTFNFSSTNNPQIGYNADTSNYVLIGSISNLRFIVGSALYTTGFTTPTSPLTAISNTVLLTCQSTRMIDNSTNALTITTSGDVRARTFNPLGYTAQIATVYSPSLHGGSAYFDGTGDYISTPAINWSTYGSYTFEFWIYHSSFTQGNQAYASTGGTGYTNFYCYGSTGTYPGAVCVGIQGTNEIRTPNNTITGFGWYHITYTYDGTTTNIFANGIKQTTTVSGSTAVYSNNSASFIIGSGLQGAATFGYMSNVRLTKGTPLYTSNFVPPAQAVANYSTTYPASLLLNFNNSGIVDRHSSNVLETVGNAQLSTAVKKYGSASMYFDGTGDYLTIPTNPGFVFGTGDFTIECWFYIVSGSAGALFDTRSGASGVTPVLFFSSSTLRYYMNGSDRITSGTTLSAATWYHVALVRSSGSSKMYLNGAQTGSTYVDTNDFILTNTINIGRGNDNANVLNGYIDELRVTKGFARYTANFTAPTSAFLGQ